jgi:hypothetical protein
MLRAAPLLVVLLAACAPAPAALTPPSPATTAAPAAPQVEAPPATATDVLARQRSTLDACYARARAARSDLGHTSVEIAFTLDDSGKPSTVDLQYRHRWDEASKECLRTAALALQFPATLRGKQTGTIEFSPPR